MTVCRAALLVFLAGALAGCRSAAPAAAFPAPRVVRQWAGSPTVAVVSVRDGTQLRHLALAQDGSTRWVTGAKAADGPHLIRDASRFVAADLDHDRVEDLVVGGRDRIAVYSAAGRLMWDYPTGGAPVLGLVAADLGAAGEVLVCAAGPPPLGLVALAPDGQIAWRASGVRTAFGLAARPAIGDTEGTLYCAADDGLVTGFDVLGQPQSSWRLEVGPGRKPLSPSDLLCLEGAQGPGLLVFGLVSAGAKDLATWALTPFDGTVTSAGELPSLPEFGRARPVAGRFGDRPYEVVAVPTRTGELLWLDPAATPPLSEPLSLRTIGLGAGPEEDGHALLLAGVANGITHVTWR